MIVSKRKLEKLIEAEVTRYLNTQPHKTIYEVEVGDMSKAEVESYLEKIKDKLINELHFTNDSFLLIGVHNGIGHININYIC